MIQPVERATLRCAVNGETVEAPVDVTWSLADFLRETLELKGTHLGCEHGVCGACTVLVGGQPARSCLMLAVQAQDLDVTTVEGLAPPGELSPLQLAFQQHHALQCGFCTPGFLLTAHALTEHHRGPVDREAVRHRLSGNLCRCTGYATIVDAVVSVLENRRGAR
ncbi:MAG TPA: (2Fe-2S)-binding protein [Candidatus Binatia bacterium]|nr:(2Fe-2S)-binding protein [Candidatus Binatia bacterium]